MLDPHAGSVEELIASQRAQALGQGVAGEVRATGIGGEIDELEGGVLDELRGVCDQQLAVVRPLVVGAVGLALLVSLVLLDRSRRPEPHLTEDTSEPAGATS
jgi:hypothetical protein